jgi:hypothetical protein
MSTIKTKNELLAENRKLKKDMKILIERLNQIDNEDKSIEFNKESFCIVKEDKNYLRLELKIDDNNNIIKVINKIKIKGGVDISLIHYNSNKHLTYMLYGKKRDNI